MTGMAQPGAGRRCWWVLVAQRKSLHQSIEIMDKKTNSIGPKRPVVWNPRSIQSHSEQAPYYKFRVPYSPKLFADLCGDLQIGSSSDVMDAGCGTGHVTEHLVNHAKRVHAVDGSAEMIQQASKFANASYYTSDLNQEYFAVPGGVDHIYFGRNAMHQSD